MGQANKYTPIKNFTYDATDNIVGRSTIDAVGLDSELKAISESTNKIIANQKLLQRDDGRLKDAAVEIHTLSREVLMLLGRYRSRGFWTPDSDFLVGDVASDDSFLYVCVIAHKSGLSFVEAPNWQRFGFAGSSDAAIAAAQAQSAANSAASSAITATAAANTSVTKASESSTAASTATSAAGSASTSSANAATAATQAINANAAAQAAAAASQAAATTSGIANSRIVYGDDESKTLLVGSADLAVASGFYETSSDVPSAGKWLINNIKSKTGAEIIQSAISTSDPTQQFTRKITGAVKTPWEQIASSSILKNTVQRLDVLQDEACALPEWAGLTLPGVDRPQNLKALSLVLQKQLMTSVTTAGSAPTYTAAFGYSPAGNPISTALSVALRIRVKFHAGNSGSASTLNLAGLGAKPIKQLDSAGALIDAVIFANQLVDAEYDGTNWIVLNGTNKVDSGNTRAAESDLFIAPLYSMQIVNNSLTFTAPCAGRLIVDSILWTSSPFNSATGGMECTTTVTGQTTKIGESLVNVFLSFAAQVSKGDVINMNHAVKNKSTTYGSPPARSCLRYLFVPS